ncbi:hypothetical protein GCM10009681_32410 [Luedemannella helvata]|uniref:Uncharacterized protein n=1 Tax=Luedemannella helvata TaxID=349315 RepID=A0ABN2KKJ3_9ACTN
MPHKPVERLASATVDNVYFADADLAADELASIAWGRGHILTLRVAPSEQAAPSLS